MRKSLKCCVGKTDRLLYVYTVPCSTARAARFSNPPVIPDLNFSHTYVGIWGWLNENALGGISLCPFFF